jgi:hypothetical protein
MKILTACLFLVLSSVLTQAQWPVGNHIILNGSSQYLDGTTPASSPNWAIFEMRHNSIRMSHGTDQVIFDMAGFGTLYLRTTNNLEFDPVVADGTVSVSVGSLTSGWMWRVQYDNQHLRYELQAWDLRGLNTVSATATTTNTSLNLNSRAMRVGAKLDGTLHCQMDVDFFRWAGPFSGRGGSYSVGQSYTPFPIYSWLSYARVPLGFQFENNLTNTCSGQSECLSMTLTATGSPTYAANSNTQPVAVGEDRTGQAKGRILLNGTGSYDYESGNLSDTLSVNWACVSSTGTACGSLTIRDPSEQSTFVDGAVGAGTYTFSFTVTDGSTTHADSTVTVAVVAVSANAGSDINCYVDEPCLIDGSATTGHDKVTLDFGDGSPSTRLKKALHQYRSTGAKTVTLTAYDAQTSPASSVDTATITVSARPTANAEDTEDLTDSGNANFVSTTQCTTDPTGNRTKLQNAINIAAGRNTDQQKVIVRANNGSGTQCEYRGQIAIPNATGSAQILVESSAAASLPVSHKRVCSTNGVCSSADLLVMPKLVANAVNTPAIKTASGTNVGFIKFRGFHIDTTITQDGEMIQLGNMETDDTTTEIPSDIIFQHCVIRPTDEPGGSVKNGITANADRVTVTDSVVGPLSYDGVETHAIVSYSSQGEMLITNNFLSVGSVEIFFGGAASPIEGTTPTNMKVWENHLYKNPAWKSTHPSYDGKNRVVKNLFEIKNGAGVQLMGNVFENIWSQAQSGQAMTFADAMDSGDWWQQEDVDIAWNYIKNAEQCVQAFRGRDYDHIIAMKRFVFRQNMCELNADSSYFIGIGPGPQEVRIEHNTARQPGGTRTAQMTQWPRAAGFIYEDNIADHATYGFFGDGATCLVNCSRVDGAYLPGSIGRNSMAIGGSSGEYPSSSGWVFPATEAAVNFTNAAGKVWSLLATSPGYQTASDGTDMGVNWTALLAATAHSVDGDWTGAVTITICKWSNAPTVCVTQ